ncbi:hypothetical protein [Coleofasciculus sp. FACHB-129]|uniref:calcium-binding protein n=1 Tax=Cyanophyceae TaxID=3028117 RepID=UPI00168993C5|nr:hypothetical protein [Coleofasciculus sp. FACHB-129]MBD1893097.1 hypothetical protein [Coleofasciculus sp. FACHB-129]
MGIYYGTPESETIDPLDPSDDYIFAKAGDDLVYGWEGNDTLYGEAGSDTLDGGTGDDAMYGGVGDDTYYVDAHEEFHLDTVYENVNEGIDTIFSSANFSSLNANVENITLIGSAYGANGNDLDNIMIGNSSDNFLWGKKGSDSLLGGDGNDLLNGYGFGSNDEYDILTGGSGEDTFQIGSYADAYYYGGGLYGVDGYALITDFNWLEGDKIEAHGSISNYSLNTFNWFGSEALDTGIYYQGDLIAVAQDKSGLDILLTPDFNFVV